MSPTSPAVATPATCPHDRGPGTTVCLRCRADAHRAAAGARRRYALRAGAAVLGVAGLVAIASSVFTARRDASPASPASAAAPGEPRDADAAGPAPANPSPAPAGPPASRAALLPAVAVGRTPLGDGVYALRDSAGVVVHFDTPLLRTRRRDKFEQLVRRTLPVIYGDAARGALAEVPAGSLATMGDLLTELPARGIALPPRDGSAITLYPGTRPGQDGPLVVSYRVAVAPAR